MDQRLAEAGVTLDEEGRPVGFGVGKEAAMRDWLHKKEEKEFKKLVKQLRCAKWRREVKAEGGEQAERVRASARAYEARKYATDPDRIKAEKHRRLVAKYKKNPRIATCLECGSTWCLLFNTPGATPKYCGIKCSQRYTYRQRNAGRVRTRSVRGRARNQILSHLSHEVWMTAGEIRKLTDVKPNTFTLNIGALIQEGCVERRGKLPQYQYKRRNKTAGGD